MIQAVLGFLGGLLAVAQRALGLVADERLRQAGRDEATAKSLQEVRDARDRIDDVRPVTERELDDRLRDGTF